MNDPLLKVCFVVMALSSVISAIAAAIVAWLGVQRERREDARVEQVARWFGVSATDVRRKWRLS